MAIYSQFPPAGNSVGSQLQSPNQPASHMNQEKKGYVTLP